MAAAGRREVRPHSLCPMAKTTEAVCENKRLINHKKEELYYDADF